MERRDGIVQPRRAAVGAQLRGDAAHVTVPSRPQCDRLGGTKLEIRRLRHRRRRDRRRRTIRGHRSLALLPIVVGDAEVNVQLRVSRRQRERAAERVQCFRLSVALARHERHPTQRLGIRRREARRPRVRIVRRIRRAERLVRRAQVLPRVGKRPAQPRAHPRIGGPPRGSGRRRRTRRRRRWRALLGSRVRWRALRCTVLPPRRGARAQTPRCPPRRRRAPAGRRRRPSPPARPRAAERCQRRVGASQLRFTHPEPQPRLARRRPPRRPRPPPRRPPPPPTAAAPPPRRAGRPWRGGSLRRAAQRRARARAKGAAALGDGGGGSGPAAAQRGGGGGTRGGNGGGGGNGVAIRCSAVSRTACRQRSAAGAVRARGARARVRATPRPWRRVARRRRAREAARLRLAREAARRRGRTRLTR